MAGEFQHQSKGSVLTQSEYESVDAHQFDSQATGDIMYASSGSQLSRLGVGSNNDVLVVSSGIPAWASTLAGLTLTSPVLNTPTVNSPTLTLTNSTGAAPTTEAVIEWDSDDNEIVVGDGASTKYFSDDTKLLQVANDLSDLNDAATARTNLGVDAAGTDNSTDVTLAGTPDYITISGQEITRNAIDLAADVTGTLPVANGGTGATSLNNLITLGTHTTGNYVTDITAGDLIDVSGGGSETATVTVNVDLSELTDMTVAEDGAADELVLLDSGVQKRKLISEINLSSFNDDLGHAAGDITNVGVGTGLAGGGASGDVTISLDFSSLPDLTTAEAGTDELVILDAGTEKRKAINEINLSSFNDDLGYGAGDITAVTAGAGLSGGGTNGAVTLDIDFSEFSDVTPVSGDKLATLDSDGATEQLTTIDSLATLFAGTGLTATSSVLAVDASQTQITAVGTINTGTWQGTAIDSTYIADAFIKNDADDASTGTITAAGFTVSDDGVINLGDEGQLVFTDDTPSTNQTGTGIVLQMTALTGLGAMECVYIDSNGKLDEADADAASTMPAIGIALEANSSGSDAEVKVLVQGVVTNSSWSFTAGADLFVGTTDNAGEVTATAPSGSGDTVQKIGVALTSTSAYFNFNTTELVLA